MRAAELQGLVDSADDAGLLQGIDQLCGLAAWGELVDLAARCDAAVEMGRQLWGVRQHIEYRLALEAPPAFAGPVAQPGAARFALGPLTEVVGQRFAWRDLAPHLEPAVAAPIVATERALRGEDLRHEPVAARTDLPAAPAPFEPTAYPEPHYRDRQARFPPPTDPPPEVAERWPDAERETATTAPDDAACVALRALGEGWSGGDRDGGLRLRAVRAGSGDPAEAVAALAAGGRVRAAPMTTAQAMAWLQWAGASGGALGARRGGAAGRFVAWSALAEVAGLGLAGEDPEALADDLAEAAPELSWWRWWRDADPEAGWVLRLAVADPVDGEAYAAELIDPPLEDRLDPSAPAR